MHSKQTYSRLVRLSGRNKSTPEAKHPLQTFLRIIRQPWSKTHDKSEFMEMRNRPTGKQKNNNHNQGHACRVPFCHGQRASNFWRKLLNESVNRWRERDCNLQENQGNYAKTNLQESNISHDREHREAEYHHLTPHETWQIQSVDLSKRTHVGTAAKLEKSVFTCFVTV